MRRVGKLTKRESIQCFRSRSIDKAWSGGGHDLITEPLPCAHKKCMEYLPLLFCTSCPSCPYKRARSIAATICWLVNKTLNSMKQNQFIRVIFSIFFSIPQRNVTGFKNTVWSRRKVKIRPQRERVERWWRLLSEGKQRKVKIIA